MAPPNCLSIHTMFTHCVQHPCGNMSQPVSDQQLSCILVKPRQSLESLPQDGHSQKVTSVLLCGGIGASDVERVTLETQNQMVIKLEKSNMPSKDILLSQVFMAKPLKSMCLNNIWNLGSLYGLSITFMHQENKFSCNQDTKWEEWRSVDMPTSSTMRLLWSLRCSASELVYLSLNRQRWKDKVENTTRTAF